MDRDIDGMAGAGDMEEKGVEKALGNKAREEGNAWGIQIEIPKNKINKQKETILCQVLIKEDP